MAKQKLSIGKKYVKHEPLSLDFIRKYNILEPEKIKIIQSKMSKKILIGAKRSGKTIVAEVDTLITMEQNPLAHAYGERKYKELASTRLGQYFQSAVSLVEHYGYKTRYEYEQKRNRTYALYNKKSMAKNSFMEYGSLDSPESTDGMITSNLGFFGRRIVDEPILKEDMLDPEKIPTQEAWDELEERVTDNLERANQNYKAMFPDKAAEADFITYYLMNDYGKHPLSNLAHQYQPQDKLLQYVIGYSLDELLGNAELINKLCKYDSSNGETIMDSVWGKSWLERHTYITEIPKEDLLIARMTKFANPLERDPEYAIGYLKKIARGFITRNFRLLAINAGLQFKPEIKSDTLVYNINNFNKSSLKELIKEGYKPTKLSIGFDIDTSRILTLAPVFKMTKYNVDIFNKTPKKTEVILIDKVLDIPPVPMDEMGRSHDLNAKLISQVIKKYLLKNEKYFSELKSITLSIDDNRKHYNGLMKDNLDGFVSHITNPIKQGHYDIIERQDLLENGIKNKVIFIDSKNNLLIDDIKECVKADVQSPKRKTSGNTNYLDRIDSVEYGLYPFVGIIQKSKNKKRGK